MTTLEELLNIQDQAIFNRLWGTEDLLEFSEIKWQAISELFYNSKKWIHKERNIWHNELRERALFSVFKIPTDHTILQNTNVNNLKNEWINTLNNCIELHCANYNINPSDYQFTTLVKLAGRKYNWDFELRDLNKKESIKIEFKYSDSGNTTIKQLAQFSAINTESKSAIDIFNGIDNCYLNYFWSNGLSEMCEIINYDKPTDKNKWMSSAKVTSPSKTAIYKPFHDFMRNLSDKDIIKQKKDIVNLSFANYIESNITLLNNNKDKLSNLFDSQKNKLYSIFSNGHFNIDTITDFNILNISQSPSHRHAFIIETDMSLYDIKADMSWGNGGAGNNNPRIKFSLINKGAMGGGNIDSSVFFSMNEEIEDIDEDPTDQEYAVGDPMIKIIDNLDNKRDSIINLDNYMVLRSGKLVPKTGGKGKKSKTRKLKKKKQDKNKTNKKNKKK